MNQAKKFLKVDFYLQTILGFIIIIQSSLVDAAWFLMPVGLWQIISAIILLVFYRNLAALYYILTATDYRAAQNAASVAE